MKIERGLIGILQGDGKVPLRGGVELVTDLYTNRISRSIRFVIKSGGRLKGTIGFKGEERIVGITGSID